MQLFGSITSPFVRRVRILLATQRRDYEFIAINVYDKADQQKLAQYSPAARVPVLVDGDHAIWDSALICEYLNGKHEDLATQKLLVLINEANDAGVTLFQFQKFSMGTDSIYAHNCQRRLENILLYLNQHSWGDDWQTPHMWLYAMLDWLAFREVINWREHSPALIKFFQQHQKRAEVLATDPRQ